LGQMTPRIRELGAEHVAIAVTATFSQIAFSEKLGVDFPMLSDWEGEIAHRYGVQYDVWKGHSGLAKRSVFVIDTDGTIVYRWVTDDALTLPDLEEAFSALQAVSPTSAGA